MTDHWIYTAAQELNKGAEKQAKAHQASLTKPAGSLGYLEDLAIQFCAWQGTNSPQCNNVLVRVFAGDHGVCQQGVSAYPQQVTAQMILNFLSGGAAISVLSKSLNADFAVVNMGTVEELPDSVGLVNVQLRPGTEDFTQSSAMQAETLFKALRHGQEQVESSDAKLFIGGEMGIGNTTSASAIYSQLLGLTPEQSVGPGTGVDQEGLTNKQNALHRAFEYHHGKLDKPLDILQHVGGFEIAALVGAYIASAQQGIPILIDGFITTAAALLAVRINPSVRQWMLFAHQSAEPAHHLALEAMGATPIVNLGLRLGEGSGAALVVPIIQSSLALHNEMATFANAGVSEAQE